MSRLFVNYCAVFFLEILLFGCNNKDMELDFYSVIGKYKSNYKRGKEFLELRSDSTYIYELQTKLGEVYRDTGKWGMGVL